MMKTKALLKVRLTQKWSETKKVNAKMPRNRVSKRQFSTDDEQKLYKKKGRKICKYCTI